MKKRPILNAYEMKIFKEWIADGNAVETEKGVWLEQTTQYRKKFTYEELQNFFKKEYLTYKNGGSAKDLLSSRAGKVAKKEKSLNLKAYNVPSVTYAINPLNEGLDEIFQDVVGKDELREAMSGVDFVGNTATGTDARKLLHLVGKREGKFKDGNYYLFSTMENEWSKDKILSKEMSVAEYYKQRSLIEQRFPNWIPVVYDSFDYKQEFNLTTLYDVLNSLVVSKLLNKEHNGIIIEFKTKDGAYQISFNAKIIRSIIKSLIMAGITDATGYFNTPRNGVTILDTSLKFPNKNKRDEFFMENSFGLVMPIMIPDEETLEEIRKKGLEMAEFDNLVYEFPIIRVISPNEYEIEIYGQDTLTYSRGKDIKIGRKSPQSTTKETPQSTTKTTDKKTALGNKLRKGMVVRIEYKESNGSTLSYDLFYDNGEFIEYVLITDKKGKEIVETEEIITEKELNDKYTELSEFIVAEFYENMADGGQLGKQMTLFNTGGKIGFDALAKKVAKRYAGQKVESKYQAEYGKKYSKYEAEEVGRKVAGKVYRQQQGRKFNGGGKAIRPSLYSVYKVKDKMGRVMYLNDNELQKFINDWNEDYFTDYEDWIEFNEYEMEFVITPVFSKNEMGGDVDFVETQINDIANWENEEIASYLEIPVNEVANNRLEYIEEAQNSMLVNQVDGNYAKGGQAGKLKDYIIYSWKSKNDVVNDNYEITNEEEMTEKEVIELYQERMRRGYDFAVQIYEKGKNRKQIYSSKSYDDVIDALYSDNEEEGNDSYDLKENILSKYGLHLEGNRVRTNFKSTAYEIANEYDGDVEQDSDYYIVSFRNIYAKGGEASFDDAGTSMVLYHEKKGNWLVPKGQVYLYLYDVEDSGSKLGNEFDWVFYPMTSRSMAWQSGYIPPLKKIWTKKFQKDHKGSEHLLGVIKAYLIEEDGKKELFIDMMSVNPTKKKKGVMSYMIKDLRDTFNLSQDQVTFSDLTDEGKKFVEKKTYADGGGVGEFPPKGELTNKDNFLLKYEKKGSDYEFFVYKPITKEVSGYNQIKHVCLNKDCPQKMNYEQFINYLYAELYLDDNKYAGGGGVNEYNQLNEYYEKYTNGGSLDKKYNFDDFGVKSYKELIDAGKFSSKFKSISNASDFDRIKFNRMRGKEQVEYVRKLNKQKIEYNLRLNEDDRTFYTVKKEVFDYANIPETEEKNFYTKFDEPTGFIFADGGGVGEFPPKGELTNKDNFLLKYEKKGSDYEFFVYKPITKEVSGYNQIKHVCLNKDCPQKMNYEQFINYLYAELYLDDNKYAGGGGVNEYNQLNEYYEKYTNGGFVGGDVIKFKYDGKDFTRKVESVDEMGNAVVNIMKTQKATINPADIFDIKKDFSEKDVIIKKIGLNEENANFLIGLSPTFAVWLADSIVDANTKITKDELTREQVLNFLNNDVMIITILRERIRGILDWLQHPSTPKQNLRELTFGEAERKAKEWHDELTTSGGDLNFIEPIENTVLVTYPPNEFGKTYYWVFIPKNYCDIESSRMGHCGRTGAGSLISLRSVFKNTNEDTITDSHVTIAYNKDDGLFYQAKGKQNRKPIEKYFPYIFDLIKMMASGQLEEEYKLKLEDKLNDLRSQEKKAQAGLKKLRKYFETDEARTENVESLVEKAGVFQTEKKKLENINSQIEKLNEESSFDFNGFGSEYQSSNDYGYEDMTDEQVKELYGIKPDMFNDFAGQFMLYEAGLIDEKPNTSFLLEKDVDYVVDLLRVDRNTRDDIVKEVLSGETYNLIDAGYYYQDANENAGDYVEQLKGWGYESVLDKIVEITGYDKEEVKENGAEYYLNGEDENFDSDSFDDIKRAIGNAFAVATEDNYATYIRKQIESALEELGTIEKLDDTGLVLSVDLSNLLNMSQISAISKELDSNSVEDIFFEAESKGEIELPLLDIDDRYEPYADDWQEYFDINNYAEGGAVYPDLSMQKAQVVNDSFRIPEFELKQAKDVLEINGLTNKKITSSNDSVDIFRSMWGKDTINAYEQAYVIFLNKGMKPIGYYHHSSGGIDGTIMDIQMISGMAVKSLAKGVIIAHNHPSGNTKPSDADERITTQMKQALKLFNIQLLDSIILTENSSLSFADEGYL